jgi:ubiquinone/menaquinone biosynthesis C-methylase UbiE
MRKLQPFRCVGRAQLPPLLADATRMPIESCSIDAVTCVYVTHHLTVEQLDTVLREAARVLQPDAPLVLMDAVLKPSRLPGRILWGAGPRVHFRSPLQNYAGP